MRPRTHYTDAAATRKSLDRADGRLCVLVGAVGTTCMLEEHRIIVQLLAGARMPPAAGDPCRAGAKNLGSERSSRGEQRRRGCRPPWARARLGQVCGRRLVPLSGLGPRRTTCWTQSPIRVRAISESRDPACMSPIVQSTARSASKVFQTYVPT